VPGLAEDRDDANAEMNMIDRQQRRCRVRIRSIYDDAVKIESWRNSVEVQSEVFGPHLRAQRGGRLSLGLLQHVLMERFVVQQDINRDNCGDDQKKDDP